ITPISSWKASSNSTFIIETEDDPNGTAILSNFLVGACSITQNHFSNIHWKVGRNSMVHNVFSDIIWKTYGGSPHISGIKYKISGSGGGRFFGITTRWGNPGDLPYEPRGILVENTTEPLYIYGGSVCTGQYIMMEVQNSKNVFIYRPEFESGRKVLRVNNSDNVALFAF
ncbi:MAG: hypothetical protein GY729_15610, partial [Desulfobacteraceae bacterium]|nr:hypothetical protein [Desulfobacteraceae bacterium]